MTLELPPDVMALWREARKALADERGSSDISDAALVETLCRRFLNPGSEDGPPHTIGYLECPECHHGRSAPVASSMSMTMSSSAHGAMRASSAI